MGGAAGARPARRSTRRSANGALEWLLAGVVVLYALQSSYSRSVDIALEQTVFFYVPFALLFALLREVEWSPRRLRAGLVVLVGLALVFVAVGFVEYATRTLLLNPKVIASNELEEYFRVNSLFFDPNIYGRFLVARHARARRRCCCGSGGRATCGAGRRWLLAVLWGGLVLTLSQSSFAGAARGPVRARRAALPGRGGSPPALLAVVIVGLVVVLAFPSALRLDLGERGVARRRDVRPLRAGPRRDRPRARPAADRLGLGRVRRRPTSTTGSARAATPSRPRTRSRSP